MEDVFLKILNMNLSAATVIIAVALARLALRRAPKKWSYLLWSVGMAALQAVLSGENGITKPYRMTLLSFASTRRFPSPSPPAFGESGVKARIHNALRWKKTKAWVTVLCALLCAAVAAACSVNPDKAENSDAPTGTPWDWTSTVRVSHIKSAEWNGVTLNAAQQAELVRLLNDVKNSEVVRGRGIPSSNVLDITTGIGYRLRWAGGIIELDFDDAAAAAALYGGGTEPGPGVWEIRNDALYAFLEALEDPTPASASDLAAADGGQAGGAAHTTSLRELRQTEPDRFAALMERWSNEVNMLGEQFVSKAREAGNRRADPDAFAAALAEVDAATQRSVRLAMQYL